MDILTAIIDLAASPSEPITEGTRVWIDGDPCTITGFDSDEDHGHVFDYRNERTGQNCWISAAGARVRMTRRAP